MNNSRADRHNTQLRCAVCATVAIPIPLVESETAEVHDHFSNWTAESTNESEQHQAEPRIAQRQRSVNDLNGGPKANIVNELSMAMSMNTSFRFQSVR